MHQSDITAYLTVAIVIQMLPLGAMVIRVLSLRGDAENRSKLWTGHCHANHVLCLIAVCIWCGLWEAPIVFSSSIFWIVPSVCMATARATRIAVGKRLLETKWTAVDILRIVFWATISPSISLLMTGRGLQTVLSRNLWGILWFLAAGLTAYIGTVRLPIAQGLKFRRVKSGTLINRVMHLSKRVGVKIDRVYVVPAGRGELTNAFALGRGVGLTDNFGEYLQGPELDSVIAHELGHVQEHHTRKRLLVLVCAVSAMVLASVLVSYAAWPYRAALVIINMLALLLVNSYVSRRFEYECDQKAAEFTNSPQAAIRALIALYEKTNSPFAQSRWVELFESHPSLIRRVQAIARSSGLSAAETSALLSRVEPACERATASR